MHATLTILKAHGAVVHALGGFAVAVLRQLKFDTVVGAMNEHLKVVMHVMIAWVSLLDF